MNGRIIIPVILGLAASGVAAWLLPPYCFESQKASDCQPVVSDLRKIREAEEACRLSPAGNGRCAGSLETLAHAEGLGERPSGLIRRLVGNGFKKEGFVSGSIPGTQHACVYYAVPEIYGETARDPWVITPEGVHKKRFGNSIPPCDWPEDPVAAGWTLRD